MVRSDAFTHGYVVGIVVRSRGDGPDDPDRFPDAIGASHVKPTFTRKLSQYRHPLPAPDAGAFGMFVSHERVVTGVLPNGHITGDVDSNGNPTEGAREGVWLVTGVYRVTFDGQFPEFDIEVKAEHTEENPLDLYSVAPYTPPPGAIVELAPLPIGGSPGQYLTPLVGGGHGWADAPGSGVEAAHTSFASSAEWRTPVVSGNVQSNVPAGTLVLTPVPLPHAVSLVGLACEVKSAGVDGAATVCIYADDGFRPGALVAATSALDASSAGVKGESLPTVTLNPGIYWHGVLVTGANVGLQRSQGKEWMMYPWAGMSMGSGSLPSIASGNNGVVCVQTGLSSPPAVSSAIPQQHANDYRLPIVTWWKMAAA